MIFGKWELRYIICIVWNKQEKCNEKQGKEWRWSFHSKHCSYVFVYIFACVILLLFLLCFNSLLQQNRLMYNVLGMLIEPLPLKEPKTSPDGSHPILIILYLDFKGFFFWSKNIVVSFCACTYHPFCNATYLDEKFDICANSTCTNEFLLNV